MRGRRLLQLTAVGGDQVTLVSRRKQRWQGKSAEADLIAVMRPGLKNFMPFDRLAARSLMINDNKINALFKGIEPCAR